MRGSALVNAAPYLGAPCSENVAVDDGMPIAVVAFRTQPHAGPIATAEVGDVEGAVLVKYHGVVRRYGAVLHEDKTVVVPPADRDGPGREVRLVTSQRTFVEPDQLLRLVPMEGLRHHLELRLAQLHHQTGEHLNVRMRLQVEVGSGRGPQVPHAELLARAPDLTMVPADPGFGDHEGIRGVPADARAIRAHCDGGPLQRAVCDLKLQQQAVAIQHHVRVPRPVVKRLLGVGRCTYWGGGSGGAGRLRG
mmetsp:Transcript_51747/g.145338  ORF Transcript_51747/g.145338 Transcript_51747/m.145338 type:complete len:249 (+) Transcript_51747:70-816(+)